MQKQYANAPIAEAIIDLRIQPLNGETPIRLKSIAETLASDFPEREQIYEMAGKIEFRPGEESSATTREQWIGIKGIGSDRKQIYQLRTDGFTFSRLAPYESWNPFAAAARDLWSQYRQTVRPERVSRLAVRYINRVDIPGDSVDLKQYFRTFPEVSAELPQSVEGFFLQVRIPFADLPAQALINQAMISPDREGVTSVVLDIDLFSGENTPQTEQPIWEFFEKLHQKKNEIFEACITESARKLFEPCR